MVGIRNLFKEVDKDYYKPIQTKSAFNDNYTEYESKGVKNKNLSPEKYLDLIRPYLSDMINGHKTQSEWKMQIQINFISSKDSEETRTMHPKRNNIEILIGNERDEIIEKVFEPLLQKYQEVLEESIRGNEFIHDRVDLLY